MDYSSRLSISYYKTITTINEPHKIYLVQHQETGKIYIKKILDIYNLSVYEQLKNSPISGIPKIIDYCETVNSLILIEEYITGDSLSDVMEKQQLTAESITSYMCFLCDTIMALHGMNPPVIHRDIKPSNILLDRDHNPILIDFNAAKNFNNQSTNDTVLLGTQGYAAPEQYGFGSSSPQTDIYSLGVLLREMVQSLQTPGSDYDPIINCCTQMNPKDRYPSVSALKNAITSLNNGNSQAKPDSSFRSFLPPGYRTRKPWKILLASLGYLFIFWISLTLEVKNRLGAMLWLERIFCLFLLLSIVIGSCNYRNIQKCLPLCQHKNKFIHYFGILLLDIILVFSLLIIMVIVENIFFGSYLL